MIKSKEAGKARANIVTAQVRDMDYSPFEGHYTAGCQFTSDHVIIGIYHKKT